MEMATFDPAGRMIPLENSVVYNKVTRGYFKTAQPKLDYAAIYARFEKHLKIGNLISRQEFEQRAEKILENLKNNDQTKHLVNGIRVPFICTPDKGLSLKDEVNDVYAKAIGASYSEMFPKYNFTNHVTPEQMENVKVADGVHYERFQEARKKGIVVGWYFANCLSEYTVPSQREAVKNLPPNLMLSGLIDGCAAFVGSPDLLMKNTDNLYPHLLCLSALVPKQDKFFFNFEAYGWNLMLHFRSYLGTVAEYWAGGITVID